MRVPPSDFHIAELTEGFALITSGETARDTNVSLAPITIGAHLYTT